MTNFIPQVHAVLLTIQLQAETEFISWLLALLGYVGVIFLIIAGVWGILFFVAKIKELWLIEAQSLFLKLEEKRLIGRRSRFAEHVEREIYRLNSLEEWRDYRYTELEAEIEAEGERLVRSWIPLKKKVRGGLRREKSLSKAIESSTERLILVEGDPGSGKSVALRHVAVSMATRAAHSRRADVLIPIFINLKELDREKVASRQKSKQQLNKDINDLLVESFNIAELKSLCFDLDIDWEDLQGVTKTEKSRELVTYCWRRKQSYKLIEKCRDLRPNLIWTSPRESKNNEIDRNLIYEFVLQSLNRANDRDIDEFLTEEFDRGLKNGTWFFLFDSFDEIPEILSSAEADNTISKYAEAISDFLLGMNTCRGVVASRYFRGPKQVSWPRFRILPLSDSKKFELVERVELPHELMSVLTENLGIASREIHLMSGNPLFLGLLCEYIRAEKVFPSNTFVVFESYIENRLSRDKERLRHRFQLDPAEVRATAEKVAFTMAANQGLGLSPTRDALQSALQQLNFDLSDNLNIQLDALEYIKLARPEVVVAEAGFKQFTFSHRRFQEYFATCLVLQEKHRVTMNQLLTDAQWRETAVTMCQTQPFKELTPLIREADNILNEVIDNIPNIINQPIKYINQITAEEKAKKDFLRRKLPQPFPWPAQALYLCDLLQSGLGSRLHVVPDALRLKASQVIMTAYTSGIGSDKKWALEVAGIVPSSVLTWLIRDAFKSGSLWLEEVAYRQTSLLQDIPSDIGESIRRALVKLFSSGRLKREQDKTNAHLKRLDNAKSFLASFKLLLWIPRIDLTIHIIFFLITALPFVFFLFFVQDILEFIEFFSFILYVGLITLISYRSLRGFGGGSVLFGAFLGRALSFGYLLIERPTFFTQEADSLFLQAFGPTINIILQIILLSWSWAPMALAIVLAGFRVHPIFWPFLHIAQVILGLVEMGKSFGTTVDKIKYDWKSTVIVPFWFVAKIIIVVFVIVIISVQNAPTVIFHRPINLIKDWITWIRWKRSPKSPINGRKFLNLVAQYSYPNFLNRFVETIYKQGLLTPTKDTDIILSELATTIEQVIFARIQENQRVEANRRMLRLSGLAAEEYKYGIMGFVPYAKHMKGESHSNDTGKSLAASNLVDNWIKKYTNGQNKRLWLLRYDFLDELYKNIEQIRIVLRNN
ncbi:hypothetical protein [Candidatus Leptofilum sp.]|uniref:hypothetical protein n=1 Tax=Candidatus Leptofilum sp. TaxID=3241576 RepID=UPI003B591847